MYKSKFKLWKAEILDELVKLNARMLNHFRVFNS